MKGDNESKFQMNLEVSEEDHSSILSNRKIQLLEE